MYLRNNLLLRPQYLVSTYFLVFTLYFMYCTTAINVAGIINLNTIHNMSHSNVMMMTHFIHIPYGIQQNFLFLKYNNNFKSNKTFYLLIQNFNILSFLNFFFFWNFLSTSLYCVHVLYSTRIIKTTSKTAKILLIRESCFNIVEFVRNYFSKILCEIFLIEIIFRRYFVFL